MIFSETSQETTNCLSEFSQFNHLFAKDCTEKKKEKNHDWNLLKVKYFSD